MGDGRGQDWVRTLDEVDEAVHGCLTILDRYEAKFTELLGERLPPRSNPAVPIPSVWDERLTAARAQADEVERLLAEQEAIWGRWREALSGWRRSVEQPAGPAD